MNLNEKLRLVIMSVDDRREKEDFKVVKGLDLTTSVLKVGRY